MKKVFVPVLDMIEAEEILTMDGTIEVFEPQKVYDQTKWLNDLNQIAINAILEFHMLTTNGKEVRR